MALGETFGSDAGQTEGSSALSSTQHGAKMYPNGMIFLLHFYTVTGLYIHIHIQAQGIFFFFLGGVYTCF